MEGFAICPNDWLIDKNIKNELALLIMISSLCNKEGFCYASNEYFAKIFNEDTATISRKIKRLEANEYIEITYKKRGFEVTSRNLRLTKKSIVPLTNLSIDHLQKNQSTIDQNVKENNISNNNINIKKKVSKKEAKSYEDILSTFNLSENLSKTIMDFVQMRNFIKKPLTNRGLELMIGKLKNMSSRESEQIEIVEQSIMNNWQGIFPLRKEEQKKDKRANRFDSGSLDVINLEDYYTKL